MKVVRPFGPTIAMTNMSENLVKTLNDYVDKIIEDEKKSQDLDYGKELVGNVKQEFLLDKEFVASSGWESFLKNNTEKWILTSTNKKIKKFKLIDSWVIRQFENEYNALHTHGGHISGVGYLKVPEDYGKTIQNNKTQNFNGMLQLVHGSKNFLSEIAVNIIPKVGDFYFFPHYLTHSVYPFKNKSAERRSISFNAFIDDDIYNIYGQQ